MHLHTSYRVLVVRVPADGHAHWVHRTLFVSVWVAESCASKGGVYAWIHEVVPATLSRRISFRGLGRREAGPAVVDARFYILVAADAEAFDGDVCGGDAELGGTLADTCLVGRF